ncbi:MAG: hypothetical protein R3E96_02085 [Planctomycetota bacterium]
MFSTSETWLAWLLTYALHSTALVALTWLALRPVHPENLRRREWMLRAALLVPVVSASLRVFGGAPSWAGEWICAAPQQAPQPGATGPRGRRIHRCPRAQCGGIGPVGSARQ